MELNFNRKALFAYTLPLILSSLAEHVLLLTDVVLLSHTSEEHLAAVGFVDAFLLCSLAYGFALNDSFQNFYARNSEKRGLSYAIFKKSIGSFLLISLIIAVIGATLASFAGYFQSTKLYSHFVSALPFIIPLIVTNFVSFSMNAYLIGNGKIKTVGIVSVTIILINAICGYVLLFHVPLPFSPLTTILISSFLAEILGIGLMFFAIQRMVRRAPPVPVNHKKLFNLLHKVALYPSFSELLFHLGSFGLFLFCSYYFTESETARITLLLAYWGVMMVPVEAFSETGLNFFAKLNVNRRLDQFKTLKWNLYHVSVMTSLGLFLLSWAVDTWIVGTNSQNFNHLIIILAVVGVSTHNQLVITALLTRLETQTFAIAKGLYGSATIISLILLSFCWKTSALSVLLSFLIGQFVVGAYLQHSEKSLVRSK
jgi:Na+-driven multidrug efflux pump